MLIFRKKKVIAFFHTVPRICKNFRQTKFYYKMISREKKWGKNLEYIAHTVKLCKILRPYFSWNCICEKNILKKTYVMPSQVNGMSSWRYWIPQVPFWPCREANLSPIWGILTDLTRILTNLLASEKKNTWNYTLKKNFVKSMTFYLYSG